MFPSPVPATPPENVTVVVNSSTTIEVRWDIVPPIDQNGIITVYEVMYQPLETFNGNISTQTMNVSGTEMSVFLIELQEFVNYTISVRAYTGVGAGPYSDEVIVMTLEDCKYFLTFCCLSPPRSKFSTWCDNHLYTTLQWYPPVPSYQLSWIYYSVLESG